jgi:hypothetical protein
MDTSPIILGQPEGGRGCPSAISLWTREVFDVIEQCVNLPGEISRIVTHCMKKQCVAHGCHTLNQLQLLLRVGGKADSVLELFLLRLDEQGLEISSPCEVGTDDSIVQVLWPRIYSAWLEKVRWRGCREIADEVRTEWDQARLCMETCGKLGCAIPTILSIPQLRGSQTRWLRNDELRRWQCHLTLSEYATFISWLQTSCESCTGEYTETPAPTAPGECGASNKDTTPTEVCCDEVSEVPHHLENSSENFREGRRRLVCSLQFESTQTCSCGNR